MRVVMPNDPKLSHGHWATALDCNLDSQISSAHPKTQGAVAVGSSAVLGIVFLLPCFKLPMPPSPNVEPHPDHQSQHRRTTKECKPKRIAQSILIAKNTEENPGSISDNRGHHKPLKATTRLWLSAICLFGRFHISCANDA
jgi:hypothetical protein